MILLLDTSTPVCQMILVDDDKQTAHEWEAGRSLAKGLLGWLEQRLAEHGNTLHDITGIGVYRGPGSFTGLRIGLTVMNTLADGLGIAIVGATGDDWTNEVLTSLSNGANEGIVMPYYGQDAHITKPRK